MISICITCKNRSKLKTHKKELYLFPNCIDSIIDIAEIPIEIVIADWRSTDWPLKEWLPDKLISNKNISYNVIEMKGEFNIGRGRNVAVKHASHNILFFLDADMLLSADVFRDAIQIAESGKAFFPICFNEYTKEKRIRGFGNLAISRKIYDLVGKWWEKTTWGDEDSNYYHRCNDNNIEIVREPYENFIHQWHPRKINWTNWNNANVNKKVMTHPEILDNEKKKRRELKRKKQRKALIQEKRAKRAKKCQK
jgi:glycosyltransferase involved in cell wall biosynthesis